jgi:hypothetical protein
MDEKTQFIEATLDWAESRIEKLINEDRLDDALSIGHEFYEWSRAPLGFDHDLEYPVDT